MSTSPTIDLRKLPLSRGTLASICARGRHHAYNLIVREFKKSGLSQAELAARVGIDAGTLSRILSRPRNLEIDTISKLLFGMSGKALMLSPEAQAAKAGKLYNADSHLVDANDLGKRGSPLVRGEQSNSMAVIGRPKHRTNDNRNLPEASERLGFRMTYQ